MVAGTLHRRCRKYDYVIFYPCRLCLGELSFSLAGEDAESDYLPELAEFVACGPHVLEFLGREHPVAALWAIGERQALQRILGHVIASEAPIEKGFERAM